MFAIATWRIRARGLTWAELGLIRPKNIRKALLISIITLLAVVASMIAFELIKEQLPGSLAADTSSNDNRFSFLKGNYLMLAAILPVVWLESMLEELLDRGFLITWIENIFNKSWLTTVLAIIMQAAIFGFRHSYDLSMRSLSVALIGLVFGIAYVVSGRNLWPLIIAHCALNTVSMVDRV
jgi:membrane protease YdiL (CAAX protease family)